MRLFRPLRPWLQAPPYPFFPRIIGSREPPSSLLDAAIRYSGSPMSRLSAPALYAKPGRLALRVSGPLAAQPSFSVGTGCSTPNPIEHRPTFVAQSTPLLLQPPFQTIQTYQTPQPSQYGPQQPRILYRFDKNPAGAPYDASRLSLGPDAPRSDQSLSVS